MQRRRTRVLTRWRPTSAPMLPWRAHVPPLPLRSPPARHVCSLDPRPTHDAACHEPAHPSAFTRACRVVGGVQAPMSRRRSTFPGIVLLDTACWRMVVTDSRGASARSGRWQHAGCCCLACPGNAGQVQAWRGAAAGGGLAGGGVAPDRASPDRKFLEHGKPFQPSSFLLSRTPTCVALRRFRRPPALKPASRARACRRTMCLERWLHHTRHAGRRNLCRVCRAPLFPVLLFQVLHPAAAERRALRRRQPAAVCL